MTFIFFLYYVENVVLNALCYVENYVYCALYYVENDVYYVWHYVENHVYYAFYYVENNVLCYIEKMMKKKSFVFNFSIGIRMVELFCTI